MASNGRAEFEDRGAAGGELGGAENVIVLAMYGGGVAELDQALRNWS